LALIVISTRADHGGVPAHRHAAPEVVTRRAVGGSELGALRPCRGRGAGHVTGEDICRALHVVVCERAGHDCVSANRHAAAEVSTRRPVGGA